MARSASSLGTASYTSTGTKTITLSATPTSGDLLVLVISATDASCTWSGVTDSAGGTWTERASSPVSTGDVRGIVFEKISNGTETSVSFTVSTAVGQAQISRVTGWDGTATYEDVGENESNLSSASTSISSGSADNTTANGAAVAVFASDRWDTMETGRSYSNSFTEIGAATTSGSRSGAWSAFKDLSSATSQTTTFSCSDTGDQAWGAILVYGDVTGSAPNEGSGEIIAIGALEGEGYAAHSGSGSIQAIGALPGEGRTVHAGSGEVVAVGALEGEGQAPGVGPAEGSGEIVAVGTLEGEGRATHYGSGAIDAIGALEGEGDAPATGPAEGSGTIDAIGVLEAEGYAAHSGSGSIDGIGSLVGEGDNGEAALGRDGRHHGYDIKDKRHPYWRNRIEVEEPDLSDAVPPPPAPSPAKPPIAKQRGRPRDQRALSPGAEVARALLGVTDTPISPPLIGVSSGTPVAAAPVSPPQVHDDDDDVEALLLLALID